MEYVSALCMQAPMEVLGVGSPRTRVTSGCKPPDVGTENQTQDLYKNWKHC